MGVIWTSRTRNRQPVIQVPVSRNSSITDGLKLAVNLSTAHVRDAVAGSALTLLDGGSSVGPKRAGFFGVGQVFDPAAYNSCLYAPSWTNTTNEASVCLVFHTNIAGSVGEVWELGGTDTDHFPFGSGAYADPFWSSRWMSNVAAPSGASFSDPVCLVFTVKDGSQKAYWNGRLWHSNTATGGFTLPATLKLFKARTGGIGFGAFAWNRFLTESEARAVGAKPWQLFAPERRPKFFSVGSGANTYAVGISETATASETVSMLASFGASVSETATASETVATTAVLNASISETATASETVSMAASFVVTIGETATASETVAMALGAATFAVDISETATASETVSMLAAFGTSISETATASDLVSMLATFLVGISETATASETVAMQLANQTYAVDISETATASDTVVMTIPTTYAISIIETVQAGDYVSMGVPSSDFWTQVTTTQSAGWGQINNTQSSGWTIIPTT